MTNINLLTRDGIRDDSDLLDARLYFGEESEAYRILEATYHSFTDALEYVTTERDEAYDDIEGLERDVNNLEEDLREAKATIRELEERLGDV